MIDDFRPVRPKAPAPKLNIPKPPAQTESAPPEPAFVPPDEVAAHEPDSSPLKLDLPAAPPRKPNGKGARRFRFKPSWPPTKKQLLVAIPVLVFLLGAGAGAFLALHKKPKPAPVHVVAKPVVKAPPKSLTVPSTLSGLQVDPSVNKRPVTGVMVENSLDARPQAGLSQAMVVFEAIAEGGITRFLALYQDTQPDNVGPIRSARPYYVQWALGFDAGYAHVGGSPEALQDITNWNVRDLNQFFNGSYYHRVSTRPAPHNVYTGIPTLVQLEATKGILSSNFTGFARLDKEQPTKQPTASSIDFAISGPDYNVHYDYDMATNTYKRSEGGKPHIDANTNTQIAPKVVIALVMPYSLEADGYHSSYNTIGSGPMYVFQNGTLTQGQWSKADNNSQFIFSDSSGQPLKLNPGQTWITVLSDAGKVSYK